MCGTLVGLGLWLVARGLRRHRPDGRVQAPVQGSLRRADLFLSVRRPRVLAAAFLCGVVAFVTTRWPISFLLGFAGVFALQGLGGGTSKQAIARIEATAAWTEMLRDTLAGAAGLNQALLATAPTAPFTLRPYLQALTNRVTAGLPTEEALIELAVEVDDPAMDIVVASLVMANRERAQRLGELLSALATASREEAAMRLGIEASRASARSAVRMITGFSLGLFALMFLFARSYLQPYGTVGGQLILCLVALLFAAGLWLMSVMVRPRPFGRLQLSGVAR